MNRSSTRSRLIASAASLALAAVLLAPAAANADALPLYIGDPTANEKVASGIFLSLGEGNVKGSLSLAAEKRWGNDYMHARYYSPNLGRFLSVDPVGGTVGSSQSWNRYAYVENNPVNLTDPTGKVPVIPIIIGVIGGLLGAEWGGTPTGPDDPVMTDPAYQNNGYAMAECTLAGVAVGIAVDQMVSSHETPELAPSDESPSGTKPGRDNAPRSTLPRDDQGNYLSDPDASGGHTTLGERKGHDGVTYTQGATFDENGEFQGRTDVHDHSRGDHPNPHFHEATGTNSVSKEPKKIEVD